MLILDAVYPEGCAETKWSESSIYPTNQSSAEPDLSDDELDFLSPAEALEITFSASSARGDSYPKSYADAMTRPDAQQYHDAAVKEVEALVMNGTFRPVKLPPGRKSIGSRWVFSIKHNPDGTIERYKARLVVKGYSQRPGFDFFDTFAPTARRAAIRTILALAAIEDLEVDHVDISTAFLNGDIDAEIYMDQIEGFPQGNHNEVLKLMKNLYGEHCLHSYGSWIASLT